MFVSMFIFITSLRTIRQYCYLPEVSVTFEMVWCRWHNEQADSFVRSRTLLFKKEQRTVLISSGKNSNLTIHVFNVLSTSFNGHIVCVMLYVSHFNLWLRNKFLQLSKFGAPWSVLLANLRLVKSISDANRSDGYSRHERQNIYVAHIFQTRNKC